jgi:uncharacterized membrane protein YdfJ with MMPL/SSD domain
MSMLLYPLGGFIDRTRVWVVAAWLLLTAIIGASSMLGTHYGDTSPSPARSGSRARTSSRTGSG